MKFIACPFTALPLKERQIGRLEKIATKQTKRANHRRERRAARHDIAAQLAEAL